MEGETNLWTLWKIGVRGYTPSTLLAHHTHRPCSIHVCQHWVSSCTCGDTLQSVHALSEKSIHTHACTHACTPTHIHTRTPVHVWSSRDLHCSPCDALAVIFQKGGHMSTILHTQVPLVEGRLCMHWLSLNKISLLLFIYLFHVFASLRYSYMHYFKRTYSS